MTNKKKVMKRKWNQSRAKYLPASISYKLDQESLFYGSIEEDNLIEIIDYLKKFEETIEIEYYKNSKIIKSIDGIDKLDYDKLIDRVYEAMINKAKIQKENDEIKIQLEQQQLDERIKDGKIKSELKDKSINKNIEDVKKELEEKNINYSIKYISSKLGDVGNVIFVGGKDFAFYVIKDNNEEEMIKVPELRLGMKKDEIAQILEKNELGYDFYNGYVTDEKNKIDTICLYQFAPGTLVPKGFEVGIGLYWEGN